MEENQKYNTPTIHLEICKALFDIVAKILDENDIKYFADGGTVGGMMRHKDIIPWDDDIDIGVFYSDFEVKLPSLLKSLENGVIRIDGTDYKLRTSTSPHMYKVFLAEFWAKTEFGRIIGTPTLDIFSWIKKGDKFKLTSLAQRKKFPNCYYLKSELLPLKKYQFGKNEYFAANNPLPYLKRYYGPDFMEYAKVDIRLDDGGNPQLKNRDSIVYKL